MVVGNVTSAVTNFSKRISTSNFSLVIMFLSVFLWVNASAIYGPYATTFTTAMLVYIVMQGVIVRTPDEYLRPSERTLSGGLLNFGLGFLITGLFLIIIISLSSLIATILTYSPFGALNSLGLTLGFGFFHGLIVAYTEELVFRGVLMSAFGPAGIWINSIAFGFFHLVAYNGSFVSIIFAIALGLVFSVMAKKFGVLFSAGAHFAYNLLAMGLLFKLFGGGFL